MLETYDEFLSGNQLAKRLGISETMVRKYRDRGVFEQIERGIHAGKYSVKECTAAYQGNRDPDAVLKAKAAEKTAERAENSLTRARTQQAQVKVERERIALAQQRGELIRKEDVLKACRAVITVVSERLDGLPGRLAPRAVGLASTEIEGIAREMIAEVRREIEALGAEYGTGR